MSLSHISPVVGGSGRLPLLRDEDQATIQAACRKTIIQAKLASF
jgi:hypothetical protein